MTGWESPFQSSLLTVLGCPRPSQGGSRNVWKEHPPEILLSADLSGSFSYQGLSPTRQALGSLPPTPTSPPGPSFLMDTGSSCPFQSWGEGSSFLRFPVGNSRGILSPIDCLPSELGLSHSCSRTGTRIGRSAQNALVFFPQCSVPAKPQYSEMPDCVSREQACQDVIGFGTKCKINV